VGPRVYGLGLIIESIEFGAQESGFRAYSL
jgi:hypothetical protein